MLDQTCPDVSHVPTGQAPAPSRRPTAPGRGPADFFGPEAVEALDAAYQRLTRFDGCLFDPDQLGGHD